MNFKTMFDQGAIPVLEKMLSFTQARHTALANNIANIDTPGYLRRDVPVAEFQRALEESIKQRREEHPQRFEFAETENIGVNKWGGIDMRATTEQASPLDILRHDGNNVSVDREMAELAKNTLLHNSIAHILIKEFSMMNTAISERVTG